MSDVDTTEPATVEQRLRAELAQGDRALAATRPVVRALLASDDRLPLDDEILAHLRGQFRHLAHQLLEAQAQAAVEPGALAAFVADRGEAITAALLEDPALLAHAHALAIEAQAAERLAWRHDIDPVTSLLMQDLAGGDAEQAGLAVAVLAAQARFFQYQRRMELPLRDLPGDLFHKALLVLRAHPGQHELAAQAAERRLRDSFDEAAGRLALIARLVVGMGEQARALEIDRAGLSIFATALAIASGQDRDVVVVSASGRQPTRLALTLRSAGLSPVATMAQFARLQTQTALPDGLEQLSPEMAAALLASEPGRDGQA